MMVQSDYQREARRADAMRRISDGDEKLYWEGYRRGLFDSQDNVAPDQLGRHERGYDLKNGINRRDRRRAVTALGYWDGWRWQELGPVTDYRQRLTPDRWLERYGPVYGITSRQYVYQMCRGMEHSSGYSRFSLPHPFVAEAEGNRWFITTKGG